MWSRRRALRIALYECEHLAQHLPSTASESCRSYLALLQAAFDHVAARFIPHSSITLTSFDVTERQYPDRFQNFDGVLISGSLSGVYEPKPWIRRLLQEIQWLDKNKVKTCGISFGHQAIAAAFGGSVAPNPKGSEVSVKEAKLTDLARQLFKTSKESFKLHYHHNDAILSLPPDFWVLASNNITQYQALYKPHHFLTLCGHPDYSHHPKVLEFLLEIDRKNGWVTDEIVRQGLKSIGDETDYEWIVEKILHFYMGDLWNDAQSTADIHCP
ncbi:putative glutamine amidotransferase-like protein C13C5.04 [Selaginella moellendorffii]|uniref:putative glutamine amidotransferase-like protein C13C5.04 n=1 Tax=Selaginella moellendorffii TaxID=88036 RepID=UPI000D1C5C70|nr:putative glutamine amidotransferase-like protein C13C5.04 [Selaginella moellendorffii]|eukprot:XP_024530670.1 putative glutamine amidotransferase-like protein C13C5.04 [Selaginella moellendorffii]